MACKVQINCAVCNVLYDDVDMGNMGYPYFFLFMVGAGCVKCEGEPSFKERSGRYAELRLYGTNPMIQYITFRDGPPEGYQMPIWKDEVNKYKK